MYKNENNSIFQRQNKNQLSISMNQCNSHHGQSFFKNCYQIQDLQKKLQTFGGMDEVEQQVLNELNKNNQRLDSIINKVKTFLKIQPNIKERKPNSSITYCGPSILSQTKLNPNRSTNSNNLNTTKIQKSTLRLKDRVEKALQEQDDKSINFLKQTKYIK